MQEPDLLDIFVLPLERAGIDSYMISGSLASMQYGEPRATLDVDLVLLLNSAEALTLPEIYPEADYYLPPPEVLLLELKRPARGHFNILHPASGLKADCYPSRSHPYLAWAIKHRRRFTIRDFQAWFAPPEYVIFWKLEFYRESGETKHLRDICGMLEVLDAEIDRELLEEAVPRLGLDAAWKDCLK